MPATALQVCGNIREEGRSNDHCARVARFALEVVAAANTVQVLPDDPSKGVVNIRAGRVAASRPSLVFFPPYIYELFRPFFVLLYCV